MNLESALSRVQKNKTLVLLTGAQAQPKKVLEKAGIERWLYNLSQQQPFAYGVLSVALALAAGRLAAAAFGLARR